MVVREQRGNAFDAKDPCKVCKAPRRRLYSLPGGGRSSKGTRLQGTRWRKCKNGHRTTK